MSGPSKRFLLLSRNSNCEGSRSYRSSLPRPRLRRPRRHPNSGSSLRGVHRKSVRVSRQLLPLLGPEEGGPLVGPAAKKADLRPQHIIGESTGKLRDQRGLHRPAATAKEAASIGPKPAVEGCLLFRRCRGVSRHLANRPRPPPLTRPTSAPYKPLGRRDFGPSQAALLTGNAGNAPCVY